MAAPVVVNQPGVYLVDADGNTVTLSDVGTIGSAEGIVVMGKDGTVARMMVVDSTGKLAIQDQPNMDVALSTLASETKLEAVRALLAAIDADTSTLAAVDYATQTTLATLATEAKLEAVRVILASLDAKDYATQTTLAAILVDTGQIEALLGTIDADTSNLDVALSTRLSKADFEARINTLGQKTMAAGTPVTIASDQLPFADRKVSGTIAALNDTLEISCEGCATVAVQGTAGQSWNGTLIGEATINDSDWFPIGGFIAGRESAIITSLSNNGPDPGLAFRTIAAGFLKVRVRASVWTSGSVTMYGEASMGGGVNRSIISQFVDVVPENSSTANLGGGASFTGPASSTLGVAAIQINCKADRAMKIQVQQSDDGINWDIDDSYTLNPSEGDGRAFQATSAFFRVIATNTSGSSTTFLRLSSVLLPVGDVLPRALTRSGNLRSALRDDEHQKPAQFSAVGLQKVANESVLGDYKLSSTSIPLNFTVATTGTGGYSVEPGDRGARLTTGASGSSKVTFTSIKTHTSKVGRGQMYKHSVVLGDAGVAGNIREWGVATVNNGVFLRLSGTTLQWVIRRGGVETVINSSDWDIPIAPDANGHLWYQQIQSHGVGDMYLYYDERLVHTHKFLGTSTEFNINSSDLPVWLRNENTSNTSNVFLKCGGVSVIMEGGTVVSGVDPNGITRELNVDGSGNLNVVFTASAQNLPLLINLNYEQSDGAILANAYKRVVDYTVPAGFNGYLIRYSSYQNESAKSRFVSYREMGTLEFISNVFTPGASFTNPNGTSVVEAEVTTQLSGSGASPITITVTYTNLAGTSGRVGTFSIPKNSIVGSRFKMTLQSGDNGVRSIQNLTDDSSNAGAIKVIGFKQLAYHNDLSNTVQLETNYQPGAIAFPTGTTLAVEYAGGTVSKDRLFDLLIQLVEVAI